MSASVFARSPVIPDAGMRRQRQLALFAAILTALLLAATARHVHARFEAVGIGSGGTGAGAFGHPFLWLLLLSVGPALPLGTVVMLRRKGGRAHRLLGRSWAVLMLLTALSGLGLGQGWSPIHLLSLLTLVTVPLSVWAAIRGDMRAHRRVMTLLFASLVVAGFFTLLPMRLLGGWLSGVG